MNVALQLELALRSSVKRTSTTVGTFPASSSGCVVQRNVLPPRDGESVSGLLTVDLLTTFPLTLAVISQVTLFAVDTSPP